MSVGDVGLVESIAVTAPDRTRRADLKIEVFSSFADLDAANRRER